MTMTESPELRQLSKQRLNSFKINEKDSVRKIKDKFMSIVSAARYQKLVVNEEDMVMALFSGMSKTKYGMLKKRATTLSQLRQELAGCRG